MAVKRKTNKAKCHSRQCRTHATRKRIAAAQDSAREYRTDAADITQYGTALNSYR